MARDAAAHQTSRARCHHPHAGRGSCHVAVIEERHILKQQRGKRA